MAPLIPLLKKYVVGELVSYVGKKFTKGAKSKEDLTLNDLLDSEGSDREEFEAFLKSLSAVAYPLAKYKDGEYKYPAVYHMWTGYCIAKFVEGQKVK